jgi:hypothetical protein
MSDQGSLFLPADWLFPRNALSIVGFSKLLEGGLPQESIQFAVQNLQHLEIPLLSDLCSL